MQQIWYLTPSGPLADAIVLHLDRAGVSFTLENGEEHDKTVFLCGRLSDAREIARQIIEADGKEFVPESSAIGPDALFSTSFSDPYLL